MPVRVARSSGRDSGQSIRFQNNVIIEPCGLGFLELDTLTDEVLIAHLSVGHDDALAVLFDRYHRLVRDVALKIVQDFGEAEDVL